MTTEQNRRSFLQSVIAFCFAPFLVHSDNEVRNMEDSRVGLLCEFLAEGRRASFIHKFASDNWNLSKDQADNLIEFARERLLASTGKSRKEQRDEFVAYLRKLRSDPRSSAADKIRCAEMLLDMFNLEE